LLVAVEVAARGCRSPAWTPAKPRKDARARADPGSGRAASSRLRLCERTGAAESTRRLFFPLNWSVRLGGGVGAKASANGGVVGLERMKL
jgi:hypothetical protein